MAKQFKKSFSEAAINALSKAVGFCEREREITPHRLGRWLIEVFANSAVQSIADIQCSFNALCGTTVQYKPFHNQLAKAQFPEFMRGFCARCLEKLACVRLPPVLPVVL